MSVTLTRLLHDAFISNGTDGKHRPLDDENVPVVIKDHRTALELLRTDLVAASPCGPGPAVLGRMRDIQRELRPRLVARTAWTAT